MGGGGAAEVQVVIEGDWTALGSRASEIGITSVTGEDDIYVFESKRDAERLSVRRLQALVIGDRVRDYQVGAPLCAVWPHEQDFSVAPLSEVPEVARYLWTFRARPRRQGVQPLRARDQAAGGGEWGGSLRTARAKEFLNCVLLDETSVPQ
jgi:hypothetical protein